MLCLCHVCNACEADAEHLEWGPSDVGRLVRATCLREASATVGVVPRLLTGPARGLHRQLNAADGSSGHFVEFHRPLYV